MHSSNPFNKAATGRVQSGDLLDQAGAELSSLMGLCFRQLLSVCLLFQLKACRKIGWWSEQFVKEAMERAEKNTEVAWTETATGGALLR